MSPGILGKKIGMTQLFRPDGQVVPVTLLKAGPCMVVQRKTPTTDGYDAVQLGFMEYAKKSGVNKPAAGHLKKSGGEGVKFLREFQGHRDGVCEVRVSQQAELLLGSASLGAVRCAQSRR